MRTKQLIEWLWVNNYIELKEDIETIQRGIDFFKQEVRK